MDNPITELISMLLEFQEYDRKKRSEAIKRGLALRKAMLNQQPQPVQKIKGKRP